MTARRSVATSDARESRALQFRPGHVGGRVASAQPIKRNGGTLRRAPLGGMAEPIPTEPPTAISAFFTGAADGYYPGDTTDFVSLTLSVDPGDRLFVAHHASDSAVATISSDSDISFDPVITTSAAWEWRAWLSEHLTFSHTGESIFINLDAGVYVHSMVVCRLHFVHPTSPWDVMPTSNVYQTSLAFTNPGVTTTRTFSLPLALFSEGEGSVGAIAVSGGSWVRATTAIGNVAKILYMETPGATGSVTFTNTGAGLSPYLGSTCAMAFRAANT